MKLGGGGDSNLAYGLLLFSVVVLVGLSFALPFFFPGYYMDDDTTDMESLRDQYYNFTNSAPTSEAVWGLRGIFTAYGYDTAGAPSTYWGYTEDGWLYGQRVVNYTPSQYQNVAGNPYSVSYNADTGLYYYTTASNTVNQHKAGDLYGSVVMDAGKKSDIFFTENGKVTDGDHYYYRFNGYRYSFAPLSAYKTIDENGDYKDVVPNTSSLSLIWYDYYGASGIAGQLIITGSDSGVSYLTASEIVRAFNADISASRFSMRFNGVDMFILIRLDPNAISSGVSVEDCYNQGLWSVMVSSRSADVGSMAGADYEFNPSDVFDTMIDLLTFNVEDYGLTGLAGMLASFVIVLPLMIGLIVIGMDNYPVLIIAGIYAVISAWNLSGVFS